MERDKHNVIVFYSLRPRVDGTVVHLRQFLFRMKGVEKKHRSMSIDARLPQKSILVQRGWTLEHDTSEK